MNYILECKFSIGDIVSPKLECETQYYIVGFDIFTSDEVGNVTSYVINCSSGDGKIIKMYDYELNLIEQVNAE